MHKRESEARGLLFRSDESDLAKIAAFRLREVLQSFSGSPHIVLGCCGGASPVALYERLAKELIAKGDDILSKLQLFFVDERLVSEAQIESGEAASVLNAAVVKEKLVEPLIKHGSFKDCQFHVFPQSATEDPKQRVESYYAKLNEFGGRFNAVVLGVGPDGHVAGIFPFPHFTSEDEETQNFVHYVGAPKPPPKRITASIGLLAESDFGMLLFQGPKKKEALVAFAKTSSTKEIPACVVKQMHKHIVVTNIDCEATKALLA